MESSKTSQTRWEWYHITFTNPLCPPWVTVFFSLLYFLFFISHLTLRLLLRLRSDCQVWSIWALCASRFALAAPSPSNMPAWYPLRLDLWQLSLKYSNSATELPGDSVAQLVRAWQAICQVTGSSPSLSHCLFFPSLFSLLYFSPYSPTLT